jgi:putative acetyltransferase
MSNLSLSIRRIQAPDVHAILGVIRDGRCEHADSSSESPLDPTDYDLFERYRTRRSTYMVAVMNDRIVGGAGISRLGSGGSVCELERMYLRRESRGLGIGKALLQRCLEVAREFDYRECYAETSSDMTAALSLYERHGFLSLQSPLGPRSHARHNRWLLLKLCSGRDAANAYV